MRRAGSRRSKFVAVIAPSFLKHSVADQQKGEASTGRQCLRMLFRCGSLTRATGPIAQPSRPASLQLTREWVSSPHAAEGQRTECKRGRADCGRQIVCWRHAHHCWLRWGRLRARAAIRHAARQLADHQLRLIINCGWAELRQVTPPDATSGSDNLHLQPMGHAAAPASGGRTGGLAAG